MSDNYIAVLVNILFWVDFSGHALEKEPILFNIEHYLYLVL